MYAQRFFERNLAVRSDAPALGDGDQLFTHGCLASKVAEMAERCSSVETVVDLIVGNNSFESALQMFAVMFAGSAVRPLASGQSILADSLLPELAQESGVESTATVVLTSGTSGLSKQIALTYRNWIWNVIGSSALLSLDAKDHWLCCLPLNHVAGLSMLMRTMICGSATTVLPKWDTDTVKDLLQSGQITAVSLVPTMLSRLLDAGVAPHPNLKLILLGGAGADSQLMTRAAAAGLPIVTTYGMTETASQIVSGGKKLFCSGIELSEEGEILVSGPTVSKAALQAKAQAGSAHAINGRFETGDLGKFGIDGQLTVTGRNTDLIITGGENVMPQMIESELVSIDGVLECAVFGREDLEWGQRVVAAVVLADGTKLDGESMISVLKQRLPKHSVPKEVEIVKQLPRNSLGKLLRRELK